MRYLTSDTHYGHRNIIDFCDRPYSDVHHMDVDLVNRAASTAAVGDELWHLGDVALGYLDDTLTNLARIAVDVTLVAGNQDRCHPYNGARGERFIDVYRDKCNLTDLILTNTRLTLANDIEVQVSHFPYPTRTRGPSSIDVGDWSRTSSLSGVPSTTARGCCAATSTRAGGSAAA